MLISSKQISNAVISQMTLLPSGFFVQGLRNAHSLAARNLGETSTNAKGCHYWGRETQHSTTTYCNHPFPSSTVNMMSNKDDQCFQCQEPGHITQHCPHIRCHEKRIRTYSPWDCPNRILPSGIPAQHHKAHRNCNTRSNSRDHWEVWERRDRCRSQSRYSWHWIYSFYDFYRGCSRSQQRDGHRCYRSSSR